jgi:hypothetical protein
MGEQLLPLFPLAVVLLPGNRLPLHIFEDRYKEMIGGAIARQGEFGIVLAARGGIASAGCTASVEEVVKHYDDGRLDIVTIGRRRFNLKSVDDELAFLRGEVEYFGDEPNEVSDELRTRAVTACENLDAEEPQPLEEGGAMLSFRLALRFNDLTFRQRLLMMRGEEERLRSIVEYAPSYAEQLEAASRVRQLASKNGHSRKPPSFEN